MYFCLSLFSFHLYLASYLEKECIFFSILSPEMGLNLKFASLHSNKI